MVKAIKILRLLIISAVVISLGLLVFGFFSIPDEFSTLDSGDLLCSLICQNDNTLWYRFPS